MHVLLVEDDRTTRLIACRLLTQKLGVAVTEVEDGLDALRTLDVARPDLVVLDLLLPSLNGLDVLEGMRRAPRHEKTAVLLMSARQAEEDVRRIVGLGVHDYLVKPVPWEQFQERCKRLLQMEKASSARVLPLEGASRVTERFVLVAEADDRVRWNVVDALCGHVVAQAATGLEALRLCRQTMPNMLVLGDLPGVMPSSLLVSILRRDVAFEGVRICGITRATDRRAASDFDLMIGRDMPASALREQLLALAERAPKLVRTMPTAAATA